MSENNTIKELVQIAYGTDEEKKNCEHSFGRIPNGIARHISQDTGINVIGALKVINPFGISHVIKYHSTEKEFERYQIPVTDLDYELIPEIVNNYDSYERATDDYRGNPGIYFKKQIGDIVYFVCMTFTFKRDRYTKDIYDKKLTMSTIYKKHIRYCDKKSRS